MKPCLPTRVSLVRRVKGDGRAGSTFSGSGLTASNWDQGLGV